MSILIFVGALSFVSTRHSLLLVLVVLVSVLHYSARLRLMRPEVEISRSSPFVETIRTATETGSRFAWVYERLEHIIPANQEALLGLRSIHTYNSLSSRLYQAWTLRLDERGTQAYGRHFRRIVSDARLRGDEFGYSGIGVLIGREPLAPDLGTELARFGEFTIYRTAEPPRLEAQIKSYERSGQRTVVVHGALRNAELVEVERIENRDDYLRFRVTPSTQPTLLFVSRQNHPHWQARSDGRQLETVLVNDFYQGVIVPAHTDELELRFMPNARWSWVPQVLFAVGFAACGIRRLQVGPH